jgi:AraC-like DNA-binding protein
MLARCCPLCGNDYVRPAERHTADRLEALLILYLPKGGLHSHVAARLLGMSERTLARNLAKEGTTFIEVVQRLRMRLAAQYLKNELIPIVEVAWLLGYDEQSSFTHAFKRWFGKAPKEFRLEMAA